MIILTRRMRPMTIISAQSRMLGYALALTLTVVAAEPARAIPLLSNGSFESGFSGWSVVDALGSAGTFFLQSGTVSPVTANTVMPPSAGATAAMTDAETAGSHVLYQDFVVPAFLGPAVLSFYLYLGNRHTTFFTPEPPTLAFDAPGLNQQARVDLLLVGPDPFSVDESDVLIPLFQTNPELPRVSGYTPYSHDITEVLAAAAGQTLRLRFAEANSEPTFQFGVDNIRLDVQVVSTPVPEPGTGLLLAVGCMGLLGYSWHARRRQL
jgi:hypothetical protein